MVIMEHPIKMDDLGYHYFWKHPYDIVNHYMSFILAQHLGRFSCSRGWLLAVNLPGEAPFWTTSVRCRKGVGKWEGTVYGSYVFHMFSFFVSTVYVSIGGYMTFAVVTTVLTLDDWRCIDFFTCVQKPIMNNDQQELGNLHPDFSAGLLYDSTSTNGVLWQLEGVSPRTEMFEEGSTGTPRANVWWAEISCPTYRLLGSTGEFADGVHDVRSYLHECDGWRSFVVTLYQKLRDLRPWPSKSTVAFANPSWLPHHKNIQP